MKQPTGNTNQARPLFRVTALLLALLLPASGCYRSVPLENGPEPGMRVVAALSREGTERMAERIGYDIVRVEGEAESAQADGWNLRLIRAWDRSGREYPWAREPVSFPRAYITRLEQHELDQRRSWLVAGAVTVGAVLLGRTFLKTFFGDDDTGNGTDPAQ